MSRYLPKLAASLLIVTFLAACATSAPAPATTTPLPPTATSAPPTATLLPTETLSATPTQPPPTDTPSPEPTSTATLEDTETPTATITSTPPTSGQYIPLPAASRSTVNIYFIQLGGGNVACGDRLIAVGSGVEITGDIEDDMKAGLQKLFSYKQQYYGDLYNPLYDSQIRVKEVDYKNKAGSVDVFLTGSYKPSGDPCDNTRVRAQVWATIRQFRGINSVTVMLNRVPFGDRLSNDN